MGLGEIIYQILIGPLQLFFEVLYTIANRLIGNYGMSIIVLSLIMNFLVLPIYQRADKMQEEQRDIEEKLHDGMEHIRKTFKGDERMMMLQTFYRQNDYKPTSVIRGSISLFLEIPFFIAAYRFLSHLACLRGVSFGPIPDLGAPDALIPFIGGMHINLLPIIMTITNVISAMIYTRGFPKKTKIQLYAMAAFFLVFLYTSPSGLVFYWTLNNVFSLVKNVFYKLKHPKQVLAVMAAIAGVIFLILGGMQTQVSFKRNIFLLGVGVLLLIPVLVALLKKKIRFVPRQIREMKPNNTVFTAGSLFLTVLIGMMIPSTFIKASPLEFVDVSNYLNPTWYIVSAMCLSVGLFLVWIRVFYWLASDKGKCIFDRLVWGLGIAALIDYLFFGKDFGTISANLVYENGLHFSRMQQVLNLGLVVLIIAGMFFVLTKWQKQIRGLLFAAIIAVFGLSVFNIQGIHSTLAEAKGTIENTSELANWELSKEGKNVIVIMMDRAEGVLVPYLMNEKPELKEQFAGFTYYSNTISYGALTNFGSPALYGGYEYTPYEMNQRDDISLEDKQNEALKVMPVLFDENGYDVTVCDPTYANYQWVPDLSIYDDYPDIDTYLTNGYFSDPAMKKEQIKSSKRNFFCFSFMKSMPAFTQSVLYNNGQYNAPEKSTDELVYSGQEVFDISTAEGVNEKFMNPYNVLKALPEITNISDENKNTFLMISNDTTHEPMLLQEPEYEPAMHVDNKVYDAENADRITANGKTMLLNSEWQMTHYHANMAALIQLGKWFDYMRENGVYDNTRIIIVADHGAATHRLSELMLDDSDSLTDVEVYFPLLMVKDFNAEEFTESDTFMTNADVPVMAFEDLINDPVNPSTGKVISNDEKTAHDQYVLASKELDVNTNNGNVFLPGMWYSVKDNIWDLSNWTILQEKSVSPFEDKQ